MNRESRLLVDIWDVVGDQISKAQRVDAVTSLLRAFQDFGIEPEEFEEATDEDAFIKNAYEAFVDEEQIFDDEDYDN